MEIAKLHPGNFDQLLENIKKNGTPALLEEVESKIPFSLLNLNIGDINGTIEFFIYKRTKFLI